MNKKATSPVIDWSPSERVREALAAFEFALKALNYVDLGKIKHEDFDTHSIVLLENGGQRAFPSGTFPTDGHVRVGASNVFSMTVGVCSIALDTALKEAGVLHHDTQRGDLRAVVYQIRCAFAHDPQRPRWHATGSNLRHMRLQFGVHDVAIDIPALNGQAFSENHIGGYGVFVDLMREVLDWLVRMGK